MTESLNDYTLRKKEKSKTSETIKTVGIVGCGDVGQEICRIICQSGMDVIFIDVSEHRNKQILKSIEKDLDRIINKWGITQSDKRAILSRIKSSTDMNELKKCDLIIESINKKGRDNNIKTYQDIFEYIEKSVTKDTIITSNNSTLTISDISSTLKYPQRAVGLHFISAGNDSKMVEVTKGMETSNEAYDLVVKFAKTIRKKVVNVNESPGHISTRLIVTLINEACETLMEGVGSVESIDATMKLSFGLQFGPFEMADRIGLGKLLKWMDVLYQEYSLYKFKASPIIKRLVRSGHLGRKTRKGFYNYTEEGDIICQTIQIPDFK